MEPKPMAPDDKPTIALVSNYDDNSCGFAAYTRVREKSFSRHFRVTVFDLKSAALMRPADQAAEAEAHIDGICDAVKDFDFVCVDPEIGLWGDRLEQCEARILKVCRAARRLALVVHRVDVDAGKSGPFALAQARLFQDLAARPAERPYFIFTHAPSEARTLRAVHGLRDVESHPLCFVCADDKAALRAASDPAAWRRQLGFGEDAVTIGVFGALSKYKDNATVVRALGMLPDRYKLVVAGGAHPFSIRPMQADANIVDLLAVIAEVAAKSPGFEERIRFCGVLDDASFHAAMQAVDYVVAPYHDAGQMASGVGSMAFELGKRVVATHTKLFLSYREAYGDCFELFDIGNHMELRDKVARFGPARASAMEERRDRFTPETMASLVARACAGIADPGFRNMREAGKLEALTAALAAAAPPPGGGAPEAASTDVAHLRRAYGEAVQVQEQLKAEKSAVEKDRERLSEELNQVRRNIGALAGLPRPLQRLLRRPTPVPRFNTILDDAARARFAPAIRTLWLMAPGVMTRKIPRANVQQGYMLAAVEALAKGRANPKMLCVGSFEDTACIALQGLGYDVDAIDPALNTDLRRHCAAHPELQGRYDVVFSTSVIEHVPEDEVFAADMSWLLAPGGCAVLTCDYDDKWREGQRKPSTDVRLYTRKDMDRLVRAMGDVELVDAPDWERDRLDFTIWDGEVELRYGFAGLAVRRRVAAPAH